MLQLAFHSTFCAPRSFVSCQLLRGKFGLYPVSKARFYSQMELRARHSFYDGKVQPSKGDVFKSIDPATGERLCEIHASTDGEIRNAVESASKAFPSWAATLPLARAKVLTKAAQLLRDRNEELSRLETADTGKPLSETSTVDIVTGVDVLDFYAGYISGGGLNGETVQLRKDARFHSTKEPLGVCVGIGAWNYPIQIAIWKSAPCLAAGNTMVYKPSEFTPLHAEMLAQIYMEAGLPPGVFNVVYGPGSVGATLASQPEVAKVSFTGQVSTGKKVAASAAGDMKYVTMELGGKSPLIILPDADIDSAVEGAMMANFASCGQICTNGTRVFVPRPMKEIFEQTLLEKMKNVRPGNLLESSTNFGPLSSEIHRKKVVSYINHGIEVDKATLLYGGPGVPEGLPDEVANGYWVKPTIFTDCTDAMKITREEMFGPVLCILPYQDTEEVVRRANTTELGLAAGVFGRDPNLAHQVASRLEAGIIWINTWGESPAEMSVGGWKQSGMGVENGRRGIESWVRNKSTLVEMSGQVPTFFSPT